MEVVLVKSTSKTTVQKVAKNTVRVSNSTTRSAVTGRYVTKASANRFVAASKGTVSGKRIK
jgi:hypothetical protein